MTIRSSCAAAVRVSDSSGVAVRATSRKIVDEPLHERFAINSVVATSLREAAVDSIAELPKLHRAKFVTVFHEPECLPNHLTCRVVTARSNLFLDESLEFGRQMNVHEPTYVFRTTNTKNVQIGQCWTCDGGFPTYTRPGPSLPGESQHNRTALDYSWRNVIAGSTLDARRAGPQVARMAVANSTATVVTIARGSAGVIPTRRLISKRPRPIAPTSPTTAPHATVRKFWRRIIVRIAPGRAPSATRTPTSRVLC